jgi:DNA-binding transcriptional LysR family regulator
MDVQGIANLIVNKVGAGILPTHYVNRLEREGVKLVKFKGCGKDLLNGISVAYLEQRSHSATTTSLLKFLKEALRGGGASRDHLNK